MRPVTILIPVYNGRDQVQRCLASVVRHLDPADRTVDVLAIDDGSPDPAIAPFLHEFQASHPDVALRVLTNEVNLGFVRTVNRGFESCADDVVVLNADTIVTAGWLDRLRDAAAEPEVATVTPLTNSGSLCTLPAAVIDAFGLHGPDPRIDACAAFIGRCSPHTRPEVITGVGFAMYITREALDLVGLLDAETFGRGYGEEVDFCLRATRLGLRHVVEDATFVFHEGGVSFADERDDRKAAASQLLHGRYRFFYAANTRERANNPLLVTFTALELALDERDESRPHVVHLLHSAPDAIGGTEKHLATLIDALFDDMDFSILHPVESGFVLHAMWNIDGRRVEQRFLLPGAARRVTAVSDSVAGEALRTVLDLFRVDVVHIQNLIGHSLAPLDVLADFDGTVVCSVRDLYLACPHYSLLYRNDQACGIPEDLSLCAVCLPETQDHPLAYLEAFRDEVTRHLDTVDHWVFASRSSADYLLRVYDVADDRINVIQHGAIIDPTRRPPVDEQLILDEPLRVAFVGRGWAKKGLRIVNQLADALDGTDIEVHHFGELKDDASPALRLHGLYDNELLPELLERAGIHIVLLPGHYAETFGHVMTESLIAGRPVIAASYGALGERIRAQGVGWTIDPTDVDALIELTRNLDRDRHELLRVTGNVAAVTLGTVAGTAPRYAALYQDPPIDVVTGGRQMTEEEDRLRRQVRAMSAVNHQMHVQVEYLRAKNAGPNGRKGSGETPSQRFVRRARRRLKRVVKTVF